MGWTYISVFIVEALLLFVGPFSLPLDNLLYSDGVYGLVLLAHLAVGVATMAASGRPGRRTSALRVRSPEVLFLVCLLFFLFSYIYALNANMDYVQRFMASGGAVRLGIDTRQERLTAALRYLPLLAANSLFYVRSRLGTHRRGELRWALPLVLVSVALGTLAFPSFVELEGLGFLGFFALVPLFYVFQKSSLGWGVLYGTAYGVLQGMLLNFWLGTYSLVTLQLVSLVMLVYHLPYLLAVLWLARRLPRARVFVFAAGWTVFEYLRSIGFLGYPWGLWGTTQIQFVSLIQIASLAGVWGVSFVVLLLNAAMAGVLGATGRDAPLPGTSRGVPGLLAAAGVFLAALAFGAISVNIRDSLPVRKSVRLALVQQNDDPRKHDYEDTFRTLLRLTDAAMLQTPELVVWSETAFVPNIRRWSRMDPEQNPLASLVREFLEYQRRLGVWLVTGNDDYQQGIGPDGLETRLDYNAAILFDSGGNQVQTYHKMHLVPFTEYFPWKQELPGVHRWLEERDVYLWEPGAERTVFRHPSFSFCTPICFEDSFPGDVRRFAAAGAEAIVNISNDFWSLTEVEGRQHAVNSAFRAVENRTPLVRATASGLTCYVDTEGRFRAWLPYYVEGVLVVDVEFRDTGKASVYTRFGDWLPIALLIALGLLAAGSMLPALRRMR